MLASEARMLLPHHCHCQLRKMEQAVAQAVALMPSSKHFLLKIAFVLVLRRSNKTSPWQSMKLPQIDLRARIE